jgi:hypothetical protein
MASLVHAAGQTVMLRVSQMKRSIRDAYKYANFGSKIGITLRVRRFNFNSSSIPYIAEGDWESRSYITSAHHSVPFRQ